MESLPKRNPVSFFLRGLGKSPAELFQPDYEKYPVGYRVGTPLNISVIYQPELVHYFLGKEHKNLSKAISPTENLRLALGHGIVTTQGSEWLEQRRKFQPFYPNLTAGEAEEKIEEIISGSIKALKQVQVKNWECLKNSVLGCLIDLNWFQLFGCIFPGSKTAIIRNIFRGNKLLAMAVAEKIPVYDPIVKARLRACYAGLHAALAPAIKRTGFAGAAISTDEVLNLLMAGAITTSGNLLFCLLHLARGNANFSRFLTDETYRRHTLMENFRLYPEVWSLWYKAETRLEHESFSVNKNELLVFDLYAMHRHPGWWWQPEQFDPERFTGFAKSRECYLPFGHGPRKCLGQHLAFTIITVFLKQLGEAFHFYLKPGTVIKPQFGAILFPDLKAVTLSFEVKKAGK